MIKTGDRVRHLYEPIEGTIIEVDDIANYFWENYGVTTVLVQWDDGDDTDIQWTNKIEKVTLEKP